MLNRIANCKNGYQGEYKKVLCVCSAGLLRSPTAAVVLSQEPFNYNTRAVGVHGEYALTPLEKVHMYWADEIVVMEEWQGKEIIKLVDEMPEDERPKVIVLGIEDSYPYRDPKLIELITKAYKIKTE